MCLRFIFFSIAFASFENVVSEIANENASATCCDASATFDASATCCDASATFDASEIVNGALDTASLPRIFELRPRHCIQKTRDTGCCYDNTSVLNYAVHLKARDQHRFYKK